jgi:PAS domain S-box-containing protein
MQLARGKTVLVVEDERVVAKDLQRSLMNLGYHVPTTAASADDAIRAASECCPDLVLMDIRIKGARDGIETAAILRSRFDIPVVYLTAYADEATVERAKKTEPHAYLLKPVKADELRSAVEIALYKHDADRRLRERERWFATTLRSIGDAVISTDAAGCITFMNPVAETLTGFATNDVRGRPLSDILKLVDAASKTMAADPIARVLSTGKIVETDGLLITREGQERVIADSAAPICDENGVLLGVVVVLRDVSEARRLQRKLEFAERLASLGTLVAGVAHEINNPLAIIIANVDFVVETLSSRSTELAHMPWLAELKEALSEAQVGAGRVQRIVADLRFFSRPSSDQQSRTDVNRVLQSCLDIVGHELRLRARIVTDLQDVPVVLANETRLSQVFVNLLLNAGHALDARGPEFNEVRVRTCVNASGSVVAEISDSGRGMTAEVVEKIFDPFFTTKEVGQGTGLGLSICHGIVKSLGGEIQVESSLGKGSCLRVIMPPAAPAEPMVEPPVVPAAVPGGRILVVEDELMVRNTIERSLTKEHQLTLVESAPEALALIDSGRRFEVILCDLMMPRVSGMELHQVLNERYPEQARRMIFVSGGAYVPEAVSFLRTMERRHLEKPFSPQLLRSTVREKIADLGPAH